MVSPGTWGMILCIPYGRSLYPFVVTVRTLGIPKNA